MIMVAFKTHYMDTALFDLASVIYAAELELTGVNFDTIVGTGFSGGVVIPALALSMGKKFVLIRKDDDDSHHGGGRLLGQFGERWIFVDDFVSSGRTRERVKSKVAEALTGENVSATFVGEYLYADRSNGTPMFREARLIR